MKPERRAVRVLLLKFSSIERGILGRGHFGPDLTGCKSGIDRSGHMGQIDGKDR
jgi:hypothetical protein